jgi:hypothetical protein
MTTPAVDTTGTTRLAPHPAENPDRLAFMRLVFDHEDLCLDAGRRPSATAMERVRLSRRDVVAAYDQLTSAEGCPDA